MQKVVKWKRNVISKGDWLFKAWFRKVKQLKHVYVRLFANNRDFGKLFTVKHKRVWVVFDKQVNQLWELEITVVSFAKSVNKYGCMHMHTTLHVRNWCVCVEICDNFLATQLLCHICNTFMQVLAKITINKNLFNKVTSFWLRFVTKRDFDCEQVEQQTRQTELKPISVVRLSEITP